MPASLWRRFFSAFYDLLILISALMLVGFVWLYAHNFEASAMTGYLYKSYLLTVTALFYGYFWVKGQTLGMMAWKIKVCTNNGQALSWPRSIARFFASLLIFPTFGLSYMTVLIDPQNRSLHDILTGTILLKIK